MRPSLFAAILCALAQTATAGALEQEALAGINAQRAAAGCAALNLHPALQSAAKAHATAMATQDFFDHTGRDGSTMQSRIEAAGYSYSALAENIAAGQQTAAEVVTTWMDSPPHRANILNCDLTQTGLAVVTQKDDLPIEGHTYPMYIYWVQTFGSP